MQVTVPAFAKLNLDLRVLSKRPDGYHELRTIFQTISLKDTLGIEFGFSRRTQIDLRSSVEIDDNIVLRAARAILEHLNVNASVRVELRKQIPLGAGLGGGSSNAAAVLMALPVLAGKRIGRQHLVRVAESLGSDVPFFLYGGTALGCGRGTELYPLPDQPPRAAVVVSTGVHISTAEAYGALKRNVTGALTSPLESPILREFQTITWTLDGSSLEQLPLKNDFQSPVFEMHRELAGVARKLHRLGARPAMMTGSGSAIFGIFEGADAANAAAAQFPAGWAWVVHFVTRQQYRRAWRRALGSGAKVSCLAHL